MKWLSETYFRLRGWSIVGTVPDEPKLVFIGYPHTSNWDFFVYLALIGHFGMHVSVLVKDGLFVGPLGWLLRRWGAIPVERGVRSPVAALVEAFDREETLIVALAPEGTRSGGSAWRSGFWRIADAADVPVLMGFVDGETKTMGLGPARKIDGDAEAWMDQARAFYEDKRGLRPQNRGLLELEVR